MTTNLELQPGLLVDPGMAFRAVPRLVRGLTSASRASLLLGDLTCRAQVAAAEGLDLCAGQVLELDSGLAAEVQASGRAILIDDLRTSGFSCHPERGYRTWSCMAAPVFCGGDPWGVLCAADPTKAEAFAPGDLDALQLLAEHVSATLEAMRTAYAKSDVDELTGLCSPRAFRDRLSIEAVRSCRFGHPLSLLRLVVHHRESPDNQEGPERVGGEVKRIAQAILETIRRIDLVARFGDAEFAVILPETNAAQSLLAGRRVFQAVSDAISKGENRPGISPAVSIGLSTLPPALTVEQLHEQASAAMRIAARNRSRLHHWDIGTGADRPQWLPCVCRFCGTTFPVANAEEQRSRRFCSKTCAAAARRAAKGDRNREIIALRNGGVTLRAIGERFGITEERVRQICEASLGSPVLLMSPAKLERAGE